MYAVSFSDGLYSGTNSEFDPLIARMMPVISFSKVFQGRTWAVKFEFGRDAAEDARSLWEVS